MKRAPLILVSPDTEPTGEFHDLSSTLSHRYEEALLRAGALPLLLPGTVDPALVAQAVARADGVLLTGGNDVNPRLYGGAPAPRLANTVKPTPDGGRRDYREVLLISEVFRQRKPLMAICRGQQILNVALGGTLLLDIQTQQRAALEHRRMDRRCEIVHEVQLTPDSLLAKITRGQKLGVNSTHHQAVARVAAPFRVVARSPDGLIEGLELKPGTASWLPFLLSVQFHPERLADRYPEHQALFNAFGQACLP